MDFAVVSIDSFELNPKHAELTGLRVFKIVRRISGGSFLMKQMV
jgi:hypothetical protein